MRTLARLPSLFAVSLSFLCALCVFVVNSHAADWAHWRGPEQNGVSRERDLPEKFALDPKAKDGNLLWKAPYGARSTPLVLNGRVYLINRAGEGLQEQERVLCLNADDGKLVWEHKFNVFHSEIDRVRFGWTNLAADPATGNVYAHGTQGFLFCFDKDGKVLWSRSLTEEYGRISGYGGRLTSPIVDGDLLIIGLVNASWGDQARGGNRFVAFDKKTGTPVWWGDTRGQVRDTYNSTPVVAVINNERLLISGGADGGVHAFRVRTGEKVWSYVFGTGAVNCSPVVQGNYVYIGHGEENPDNNLQGRVICLDGSKVKDGKPELVWKADELKAKFASPILHDGRLYICDEVATMYCLDAKSGKQLWDYSYGTECKGSPVWADGKIYVGEVDAKFHILKPGADGCEALHAQYFRAPPGQGKVEINGSPAIVNGRVYFTTSEGTYCIGKPGHKAKPDPIPPQPKEPGPAPKDPKLGLVQIVPADVVLEPGESVTFQARLFDDGGRFLRQVEAQWSLAPPPLPEGMKPMGDGPPPLRGDITAQGKLTVDKAVPGQFGLVVAKAEGLTGQARVRVVPRLPYQQDFEKVPVGAAPGGWVNCQGKFVVQQKGDAKVLMKTANIASPLVSRAYTYISKPSLTDYTIQADLMGTQKGDDMPDMGIGANRYTLMLAGKTQSLRLISGGAVPRVEKTAGWPWKPDVWYRLKLTVEVGKDKAIIRGKVWPRDQVEPKDWTVEFEDPSPNREGSPALYGYAYGIPGSVEEAQKSPGAEIYYDNLSVTPNKP
jgi:outer membrane protein assembly factor BamB